MQMINRNKSFKIGNNNSDEEKFPIKFDIAMLNAMIGYIYKPSGQITKKALLNMNRLFNKIDINVYNVNSKLMTRVKFIRRSLDGYVNKGINNRDLLVNYAKDVNDNEEMDEILDNIERYTRLNFEEIKSIKT